MPDQVEIITQELELLVVELNKNSKNYNRFRIGQGDPIEFPEDHLWWRILYDDSERSTGIQNVLYFFNDKGSIPCASKSIVLVKGVMVERFWCRLPTILYSTVIVGRVVLRFVKHFFKNERSITCRVKGESTASVIVSCVCHGIGAFFIKTS